MADQTWCPCCGPDVTVDEDGCCRTCGADAMGDGATAAHAAISRAAHLEAGIASALAEMDAKAAKGRDLAKAGDGYGDDDPYHDGAAAGFSSAARILRESTAIGGEVTRG